MATSTRRKAIELWGKRLPPGSPEKLAKILFAYDNPPGTTEVSGSQDTIGIIYPGLNKADYAGKYWPERIQSVQDETVLQFIEQSLYLMPIGQRPNEFHVLENTRLTADGARALAQATESCWAAILQKDRPAFGRFFRDSFEAQIAMFPNMLTPTIQMLIEQYGPQALGWKISGAGGGGYVIFVAEQPIPDAVRVIIRREDHQTARVA